MRAVGADQKFRARPDLHDPAGPERWRRGRVGRRRARRKFACADAAFQTDPDAAVSRSAPPTNAKLRAGYHAPNLAGPSLRRLLEQSGGPKQVDIAAQCESQAAGCEIAEEPAIGQHQDSAFFAEILAARQLDVVASRTDAIGANLCSVPMRGTTRYAAVVPRLVQQGAGQPLRALVEPVLGIGDVRAVDRAPRVLRRAGRCDPPYRHLLPGGRQGALIAAR